MIAQIRDDPPSEADVAEFFQRIGLAFKCLFLVLFAGRLPDDIPPQYMAGRNRERENPAEAGSSVRGATRESPPVAASPVPGEADRAVQLLALFQRDGRLVDFLCEDIAAYPDDQVGAAVREVHASCRLVLEKYIGLEAVLPGEEGRPTIVEPGFDPAAVKLVGSVTGKPPFRGVLRHRGWRARRVELPSLPPGDAGRTVIAPAEVEIG